MPNHPIHNFVVPVGSIRDHRGKRLIREEILHEKSELVLLAQMTADTVTLYDRFTGTPSHMREFTNAVHQDNERAAHTFIVNYKRYLRQSEGILSSTGGNCITVAMLIYINHLKLPITHKMARNMWESMSGSERQRAIKEPFYIHDKLEQVIIDDGIIEEYSGPAWYET